MLFRPVGGRNTRGPGPSQSRTQLLSLNVCAVKGGDKPPPTSRLLKSPGYEVRGRPSPPASGRSSGRGSGSRSVGQSVHTAASNRPVLTGPGVSRIGRPLCPSPGGERRPPSVTPHRLIVRVGRRRRPRRVELPTEVRGLPETGPRARWPGPGHPPETAPPVTMLRRKASSGRRCTGRGKRAAGVTTLPLRACRPECRPPRKGRSRLSRTGTWRPPPDRRAATEPVGRG